MNQKAENRKRRRKINPVDAVIAVIFLLSLAAMIYLIVNVVRSEEEDVDDQNGVTVEYRLKIDNVDAERFGIILDETTAGVECDFLKIGDVLYNPDGSAEIGTLAALQYEDATASTGHSDSEGNLIYAQCPGKVNLILTVRGELSGNTLTVGGVPIRVGKQIAFHTPTYTAYAEILSVETEVE